MFVRAISMKALVNRLAYEPAVPLRFSTNYLEVRKQHEDRSQRVGLSLL
jgi:hypothetical protein